MAAPGSSDYALSTAGIASAKSAANACIHRARDDLVDLSHRIHGDPELGFEEHHAAGWICEILHDAGFAVESGVGELPTAFTASYGTGPLTVAVCAEYDALPDVGHACGHNVIAASAVGAGLALASVVDDLGLTVKVIGCPAEENGGGKVLLLDRGVFDGVHAAMMVHPSPDEDPAPRTLAISDIGITYRGKAAHASGYPERGINAADALSIGQVALAMLRQHILPEERIHGITTHGGEAPNIIPALATAVYYMRAASLVNLRELEPRVRRCFEAGALATGCEIEIAEVCPAYSEFEPDADLVELYRANATTIGRPAFKRRRALGSTDMANVSLTIPTIQPMVSIECAGSSNHQPEFATHCAGPSADRAIVEGGLSMAWTAIDLATNPALRARLLAGQRSVLAFD